MTGVMDAEKQQNTCYARELLAISIRVLLPHQPIDSRSMPSIDYRQLLNSQLARSVCRASPCNIMCCALHLEVLSHTISIIFKYKQTHFKASGFINTTKVESSQKNKKTFTNYVG